MIKGQIHQGSGLGNQLHRYVAVRCLALDKGYDFSFAGKENFKGGSFLDLNFGNPSTDQLQHEYQEERINIPNGTDVRPYDKSFLDIKDSTNIDGEFQDPKYFMHRLDEVREWLTCDAKPFNIPFIKPAEICVLNVRGGEYKGVSELFLPKSYWYTAMEHMKEVNPNMRFAIVTDDKALCHEWFPNFQIRHDIHGDWSAIKEAHYLILSNSSFAILPALLNTNVKKIIAPKYWARHNVSDGYWAMEQNKYDGWFYQDKEGNLAKYEN